MVRRRRVTSGGAPKETPPAAVYGRVVGCDEWGAPGCAPPLSFVSPSRAECPCLGSPGWLLGVSSSGLPGGGEGGGEGGRSHLQPPPTRSMCRSMRGHLRCPFEAGLFAAWEGAPFSSARAFPSDGVRRRRACDCDCDHAPLHFLLSLRSPLHFITRRRRRRSVDRRRRAARAVRRAPCAARCHDCGVPSSRRPPACRPSARPPWRQRVVGGPARACGHSGVQGDSGTPWSPVRPPLARPPSHRPPPVAPAGCRGPRARLRA